MRKFDFSIRNVKDRETLKIIEAHCYVRKLEEILKAHEEQQRKTSEDKTQEQRR